MDLHKRVTVEFPLPVISNSNSTSWGN